MHLYAHTTCPIFASLYIVVLFINYIPKKFIHDMFTYAFTCLMTRTKNFHMERYNNITQVTLQASTLPSLWLATYYPTQALFHSRLGPLKIIY